MFSSCIDVANSPPNKKLNLSEEKEMYRQLFVSLFDDFSKIKKSAERYAPPGIYSYSYASAFDENKAGKSGHYIAYGYDPGDSEKLALEFCEKNKNLLKDKKSEVKKCKIVFTERYKSEKYFSSTHKCIDLGIVEHPNHLKCVNHFEKIRAELLQAKDPSSFNINISDILSSLLILEIALTSLQPSTISSDVTCMMTSTALTGSGGLNGITCH
tara:strand:+ start:255 stop:893 length:639 start_codon:yes stop_codon:yes gene_type:complete